ncbi:hypothetical protein FACS1894120_1750 [Clostridia bacterium]|nr:hypothetical protein FACS1894120_1750 [Clostridia bacterium]
MAGKNFKKVRRSSNEQTEDKKSDIQENGKLPPQGNIHRVKEKPQQPDKKAAESEKTEAKAEVKSEAKPEVKSEAKSEAPAPVQEPVQKKVLPRVPGSPAPLSTPLTHGMSSVVGGERETVYGDSTVSGMASSTGSGIARGRGMLTVGSLAEKRENDERRAKLGLKPQGEDIFALDIGTRTVVGVFGHAEAAESGDVFVLRECVSAPHMKRAMIDGQIEDIRQVAKVVAKVKMEMEEKTGVAMERVSIAAAGRALTTRHTTMEFDVSGVEISFEMIKSMEIETILKAQRDLDTLFLDAGQSFHCVGHSIVAFRLDDHKILSLEGHKGETASVELIATFLPNLVVEGLYTVMEMNELSVASLTLEPIAAMNAIVPVEIRLINIALIDIGAGTSDIAIVRDGSIIAYNMATTAGDEITEEIIKAYFVDFATAEKIKIACCAPDADGEKCVYHDIFGMEQSTTPADFAEKIKHAVTTLAETICDSIIESNGSSPSAVFLIGGGSLIAGLKEEVAKRLGLDEGKVAIGSERNLGSVNTGGRKMGAEFVTPLGIALTCILNKGYDFSVITLNEKKVRVFDTKKLSVFELLNMNGFRPEEIMGRSGRSLTYYLNGRSVVVKGGNLEPAVVQVNGTVASLSSTVSNGDSVEFTPAVIGRNGAALVSEIVDFDKYNSGYVKFGGEKHEIGVEVLVNGKVVHGDYSVQPLDKLEVYGILTIDDLMHYLGVEVEDTLWKVADRSSAGSRFANGQYVLKNGDCIEYADDDNLPLAGSEAVLSEADTRNFTVPSKGDYVDSMNTVNYDDSAPDTATNAVSHGELVRVPYVPTLSEIEGDSASGGVQSDELTEPQPLKTITLSDGTEAVLGGGTNSAGFDSYPENSRGEITVNFNGKPLTLPDNGDRSPHLFLELLNHADMDTDDPKGGYTMRLNGAPASFNDVLTDGDDAVLGWDEHVSGLPGVDIDESDPLKIVSDRGAGGDYAEETETAGFDGFETSAVSESGESEELEVSEEDITGEEAV